MNKLKEACRVIFMDRSSFHIVAYKTKCEMDPIQLDIGNDPVNMTDLYNGCKSIL